jgi:hypothetical protein
MMHMPDGAGKLREAVKKANEVIPVMKRPATTQTVFNELIRA